MEATVTVVVDDAGAVVAVVKPGGTAERRRHARALRRGGQVKALAVRQGDGRRVRGGTVAKDGEGESERRGRERFGSPPHRGDRGVNLGVHLGVRRRRRVGRIASRSKVYKSVDAVLVRGVVVRPVDVVFAIASPHPAPSAPL